MNSALITGVALSILGAMLVWGVVLLILGKGKHIVYAKLVQVSLYLGLVGLTVNTYNAALKADQSGTSFQKEAVFGTLWPEVSIMLIILIMAVQIHIHRSTWKKKK